jgi:hypothetical protein
MPDPLNGAGARLAAAAAILSPRTCSGAKLSSFSVVPIQSWAPEQVRGDKGFVLPGILF